MGKQDVMGVLEFVLMTRLDISKRLGEKINEKMNTYASERLKNDKEFSSFSSLVNQLSEVEYADMKILVGEMGTDINELFEDIVVVSDLIKERQKMLEGHVLTWTHSSGCHPYAYFSFLVNQFNYQEHLIQLMYRLDAQIEKSIERINLNFPLYVKWSSKISLMVTGTEIENGDENDN